MIAPLCENQVSSGRQPFVLIAPPLCRIEFERGVQRLPCCTGCGLTGRHGVRDGPPYRWTNWLTFGIFAHKARGHLDGIFDIFAELNRALDPGAGRRLSQGLRLRRKVMECRRVLWG